MSNDIDYRLAFDLAPIGMVLSRNRTIVDCNQRVCDMFGVSREQLTGQSFQLLYPSADEYERTGQRIAPILNAKGVYADDRVMKRVDGRFKGEVFWCHVTGRALDPADPDHAAAVDLAPRLAPDETQLLYSMCLHGRGELGLAPDEYAALTMVLLRLLLAVVMQMISHGHFGSKGFRCNGRMHTACN